jgi:hypothetical protein
MKITKERVEQILPQNIKETTLLSDNAKNVLAMMMHSLLVAKGAQDSGVLVISNNRLRALLEMNRDYMLNAIRELEEYELVTRIVGKTRTEGEPSTASEYHFNWDNIYNKPLNKKTSEELFSKFFKPSGTPSGTAITTTITTTTAIATSSAIASTNSIIKKRTLKQKDKKEIMLTYSIIELLFVFICPCLSWEKLRLKNILLDKGRKKLYFQLDILTFLKNMQLLELLNYVILEKHENLILKILSKPSISLVNRMDIYEQLHMKYNVDITDKEMKEFYLCMRYLADKNNKTNQEERLFKIASVEMQNLLNED